LQDSVRPEFRKSAPAHDAHPKEQGMDKKFLTYAEAEQYLNIKVGTLQSMVCREEIPHIRLGKRNVRFDRDELEAWLAQRRVPMAVKEKA
jgi:excisionase family DNA binding protein